MVWNNRIGWKISQKLMIINRGPIVDIDNQKYIFDYSACNYPVGVVEDQIYYFNEENIDKVVFEGYSDQDEIMKKYYIKGDPHFNEEGNDVVFKILLNNFNY